MEPCCNRRHGRNEAPFCRGDSRPRNHRSRISATDREPPTSPIVKPKDCPPWNSGNRNCSWARFVACGGHSWYCLSDSRARRLLAASAIFAVTPMVVVDDIAHGVASGRALSNIDDSDPSFPCFAAADHNQRAPPRNLSTTTVSLTVDRTRWSHIFITPLNRFVPWRYQFQSSKKRPLWPARPRQDCCRGVNNYL